MGVTSVIEETIKTSLQEQIPCITFEHIQSKHVLLSSLFIHGWALKGVDFTQFGNFLAWCFVSQ